MSGVIPKFLLSLLDKSRSGNLPFCPVRYDLRGEGVEFESEQNRLWLKMMMMMMIYKASDLIPNTVPQKSNRREFKIAIQEVGP